MTIISKANNPVLLSKKQSALFRPGTKADSYMVFKIFEQTLADLTRRMGSTKPTSFSDPQALEQMWLERRSLYNHLAETAAQFWIAERSGEIIGFSRSILRDGLQQLTELFVLPGQQSGGVGRELLNRAFPGSGVRHRSIIATADFRAQALYLRSGVYPRFPIYYFWRKPGTKSIDSDLMFSPISNESPETLDILAQIDGEILEHRRDSDHIWLSRDRQGYLYYRNRKPAGYGYVGKQNGPFALLDAHDYPAVLAHAETQAAVAGRDEFGIEVPMVNQTAVDYLLANNFRLDSFMATMMSDTPFGKFEHYIISSPPFFM